MLEEIIEAWRVNHRVNLLLINNISEEGWAVSLSTRGGRCVAQQFAHMHNVRVMWMKSRPASLQKILPPVKNFESRSMPSKSEVVQAHTESANAMEKLFAAAVEEGKLKGYKRSVITFFAYLLAHDAHHRGNIMLTLKQTGNKIEQELQFALWDWEKI